MQGRRREGGAFLCVLQLTSIQYLGLIILKLILAFTKKILDSKTLPYSSL